MSTTFDLNISKYSKDELMELLNIKEPYDEETVDTAIDELANSLELDNEEEYTDYNHFLDEVREKLLTKDDNNADPIYDYESPYKRSLPDDRLNVIKRRTTTQSIHINSLHRNEYYTSSSSNFTLSLPYALNNVLSMQIKSIKLPESIYVFNSENNTFTVGILKIDNSIESCTIVLPIGNLSYDELETYINTKLASCANDCKDIRFTIDKYSHKTAFYIVSTNTTIQSYSVNLMNSELRPQKSCGWTLGFRSDTQEFDVDVTQSGTINQQTVKGLLVSDTQYEPCLRKYIFVVCDDFNKNVRANTICQNKISFVNNNILGHFLLYKYPDSCIQYDIYPIAKRIYFGPVSIDRINVKLVDEYGELVDLNSGDFSFIVDVESDYS